MEISFGQIFLCTEYGLMFVRSEESYLVFDYATLENVEVGEEQADKLYLRLEMKPNSEGRCEQMALVAENK